MVFVHSRKDTVNTAKFMQDMAKEHGTLDLFQSYAPGAELAMKKISKSRNADMRELFQDGFGVHHAGMTRPDRSMTEDLFSKGHLKVF
jgi:replicative superfamily II helicase